MQQRNWQLNTKYSTIVGDGHFFVRPMAKNILFSRLYLKQFLP